MKLSAVFAAAVLCVPLNAQAENYFSIITPGMDRAEVHEAVRGGTVTSNGLKEVYDMGGEQAVLHYCGDTLMRVYVIEEAK